MKKLIYILIIAALSNTSYAQVKRSEEFHSKYKLKETAIFSRHNVRAPLTTSNGLLERMTPHKWIDWTTEQSQLTMKGGMLETAFGEYFHQWTVSEGLFTENEQCDSSAVMFYANNTQRTVATARHFLSGLLPLSKIEVKWDGDFKKRNPDFDLRQYGVTDSTLKKCKQEQQGMFGTDGIKRQAESVSEGMKLIQEVLDLKESKAYKSGEVEAFGDKTKHDIEFGITDGEEPHITGDLRAAGSASDALVLQYYQNPDSVAAGFGHCLTRKQWRDIGSVVDLKTRLHFCNPYIYSPRGQKVLKRIVKELQNPKRKFFFMCGHDSNILCILSTLDVEDYTVDNAIEPHTPIGSKIVFEKWEDKDGKEYIAINHVYQSIDQIRNTEVLTLSNPPMIKPLKLKRLKPNADGLYQLTDFVNYIESIGTNK